MKQLFLAIDDVSIPFRKNVGIYLTKPTVRPEPVLRPSPRGRNKPDDVAAHFYGTVLQDQGKFRMWYYACHWGINADWPPHMMQQVAKSPSWFRGDCPMFQGPICYAESDDGITWTKPDLHQVLFKGSTANNAIALPHTVIAGVLVMRDDDEPEPARRYKMTYQYFPDQAEPGIDEYGWSTTIALAVSPDGLEWTVTDIPFVNQFVEPSSFIKHNGKYIVHYHVADTFAEWLAEGGTPCGRTGVARVSPDFVHWPDVVAEAFGLAEPEDVTIRGLNGEYDQVHLGVGATSFGNVCVGLYGLWHNADFTNAFAKISGDFGLLISNDGIHFREPVKGHRFLRREESPATPVAGHDFHTVLCQANGILNVGGETRIYHGRWLNVGGNSMDDAIEHYAAEVGLATIPRDRWGAFGLNPSANEGAICTAVLTLPPGGCSLTLNADGNSGLTVDLLDDDFRPVEGFIGGTVAGDGGLDCPVTWTDRKLADLGGLSVRVRINVRRQGDDIPRVYALGLD